MLDFRRSAYRWGDHGYFNYSKLRITRTARDRKISSFELYENSSSTMNFERGNEGKVWESCTSYAIIRVIPVRVMRSLLYCISSESCEMMKSDFYRVIKWI